MTISRRKFVGTTLASSLAMMSLKYSGSAFSQSASRTINVYLQSHPLQKNIKFLNGGNGSVKPIFPGYPDLNNEFNNLGVSDVRVHDWFGPGDLDGKTNASNVNQPVYSTPSQNASFAQKLISDMSNKRVIALDIANVDKLNWLPTDNYIKTNMQNINNGELLFRIGRSLGASNKYPTSGKDLSNFVSVVKALVARYGVNYKSVGLPKPIKRWELFNEPDLGASFFSGTPAEFYSLYSAVFKAVKQTDSTAKIGSPGFANAIETDATRITVDEFLKYAKNNKLKIDFLAWHRYGDTTSDPYDYYVIGKMLRDKLNSYGFNSTESYLTEWNITPLVTMESVAAAQTAFNAAYISSALTYMQDAQIDKSYFYRFDGMHLGLFNAEKTYTFAGKAFVAFNQLRKTPFRLAAVTSKFSVSDISASNTGQDTLGYTVLAGTDIDVTSGKKRTIKILISNYQINKNYVKNWKTTYKQYIPDTKSDANNVDSNIYYGSENPSTLNNINDDNIGNGTQFSAADTPPQQQNYQDNNGLILNLTVPPSLRYKNYQANFDWILGKDNSTLSGLSFEALTSSPAINGSIPANGVIVINRPELVPGSVLLITVDLS